MSLLTEHIERLRTQRRLGPAPVACFWSQESALLLLTEHFFISMCYYISILIRRNKCKAEKQAGLYSPTTKTYQLSANRIPFACYLYIVYCKKYICQMFPITSRDCSRYVILIKPFFCLFFKTIIRLLFQIIPFTALTRFLSTTVLADLPWQQRIEAEIVTYSARLDPSRMTYANHNTIGRLKQEYLSCSRSWTDLLPRILTTKKAEMGKK